VQHEAEVNTPDLLLVDACQVWVLTHLRLLLFTWARN